MRRCNSLGYSTLAFLIYLAMHCCGAVMWTGVWAQVQHCGSGAGGAKCTDGLCCSQYGYCGTTIDYCGIGCQSGPCTNSHGSGGPPAPSPRSGPISRGNSSVSSIVTSSLFSQFLSQNGASGCPSDGFYTYDAFIEAAASFSDFGTTGSLDVQKQEVAAFFANVAHETGRGCYVNEIEDQQDAAFCDDSAAPCASDQQYYGRGPLQLTWNYNYQAAGDDVGFDGINNPGIVAQDPTISFKTALWFWMTQQPQTPTCHDAMVDDKEGFGSTIEVINGALECGSSGDLGEQQHRISLYQSFCSNLGVDPGNNLTC